jgi:hypothetical protein
MALSTANFSRPLRAQHPVYRTTSNQLGYRPPTAYELNRKYAVATKSFTETFAGGPKRSAGLNTFIARPRVDTKEGLTV